MKKDFVCQEDFAIGYLIFGRISGNLGNPAVNRFHDAK
jgi:hypothetical protein